MQGNVCLIAHHPFWAEPLGCGTLMRARYNLLKRICNKVYVLYITQNENNCPLPGRTLNLKGRINQRHITHIQKFLKSHDVSTCYFSYDQLGFLTEFTGCKNVVEIHDVMHLRQAKFNEYGADAPYKTKKEDEIRSLRRYDHVLSLNLNEVIYLKENGLTNTLYLPPNFQFNSSRTICDDGSFGLIGSMAKPNLDGFMCLGFPLRHSDRFVLAGPISINKEVVTSLGPSVSKLGVIENPASFYSSIEVALSPIRFGGGLKIKVFEALSFGKPVLATKHSIDGFPKNIEDVVTIVDDISSWNLEMIQAASETPSSLIKDFFVSNFSEEYCKDILKEVL